MGDPPARRRVLLFVGLIGAGVTAFLGMLAPHDGALWRIESVLKQRVASALSAEGFPGLDVEMSGQRVILRGIVEQEADIVAARRAALTAAGAGGMWAGGVTSVNASSLVVGAIERPFAWSVRRDESRVVLSGAAPSENARAELMTTAAQTFQNLETVDDMHVAGGAASPQFTDLAKDAVRAVAQLNTGEVRIIDNQVIVIGDGGEAGVARVRDTLEDPPAPFRARVEVTIDGLNVDHPELQGLNLNNGDA